MSVSGRVSTAGSATAVRSASRPIPSTSSAGQQSSSRNQPGTSRFTAGSRRGARRRDLGAPPGIGTHGSGSPASVVADVRANGPTGDIRTARWWSA
ncbi:hypothetical protein WDV94_16840 [Clavibacter tessellarius]